MSNSSESEDVDSTSINDSDSDSPPVLEREYYEDQAPYTGQTVQSTGNIELSPNDKIPEIISSHASEFNAPSLKLVAIHTVPPKKKFRKRKSNDPEISTIPIKLFDAIGLEKPEEIQETILSGQNCMMSDRLRRLIELKRAKTSVEKEKNTDTEPEIKKIEEKTENSMKVHIGSSSDRLRRLVESKRAKASDKNEQKTDTAPEVEKIKEKTENSLKGLEGPTSASSNVTALPKRRGRPPKTIVNKNEEHESITTLDGNAPTTRSQLKKILELIESTETKIKKTNKQSRDSKTSDNVIQLRKSSRLKQTVQPSADIHGNFTKKKQEKLNKNDEKIQKNIKTTEEKHANEEKQNIGKGTVNSMRSFNVAQLASFISWGISEKETTEELQEKIQKLENEIEQLRKDFQEELKNQKKALKEEFDKQLEEERNEFLIAYSNMENWLSYTYSTMGLHADFGDDDV